jgi:hypothetical protein
MALMSPYVRDSHDRSADINSMSHLPDKATNRHQPYIRLREEGARDDCSHRNHRDRNFLSPPECAIIMQATSFELRQGGTSSAEKGLHRVRSQRRYQAALACDEISLTKWRRPMSNDCGKDKTSDAERTGGDADKNREQLARKAERAMKDAAGKLPKDEVRADEKYR